MRTLIAPLDPEVESQVRGLDRKRAEIARRYIRRLMLEPYLGYPLRRGRLASERCRAVRLDHDHRPEELFGPRHRSPRRGDQDPGEAGPKWRIVYWPAEPPDRELRLIVVLAVGIAHPKPGQPSAFRARRTTAEHRPQGEAMTITLIRSREYARLVSELPPRSAA